MIDDTATAINRPVRLHRNRPMTFSFARFILVGLTRPVHTVGDPTYQGARLVIITNSSVEFIEPLLGERFSAGPEWHLHTTLVLAGGEPVVDIVRVHSPFARTLRHRTNAPALPNIAASPP